MNTYSLKLKPYKQFLGALSLDRFIAPGISIFLIIVTIGVVYFGRTNYFFAFCIMLSIYGVLLGYLLAKMEYQSLLPSTKSYKYLQLLSSNFPHLEVLVSTNNTILYQNKPTTKGSTFTNKSVLELIDEINLHELDKVALCSYFESYNNQSFATIYPIKLENGIEKWMSFSLQPTQTEQGEQVIIFQIEDITEAQQVTLSQQQYIKDMENIIELNYNPNSSLHLISKMANSKDLQQPIKTIQSYVKVLEQDYQQVLGKKGQEAVQGISASSYQLERLVEDMFSTTELHERKTKEPLTPLSDIVSEVKKRLKSKITNSKAQIISTEMPNIKADQNQLYVLFQNLIENAINFCGQKAPIITIDCKQEGQYWIVSVSDQGMGIAEKDKTNIFEYLNRGQVNKDAKGLGLGLPICKQIVQNHNGDIWVESDGVGKGSRFVFTLPIEPAKRSKSKNDRITAPVAVTA